MNSKNKIVFLLLALFMSIPDFPVFSADGNRHIDETGKSIEKFTPLQARRELRNLGLNFEQKNFFTCVAQGDIVAVQLYLKCGMSPSENGIFNEQYTTALIIAISKRNTDIAIMLINAGADLNARCGDGTGPMHKAVIHGLDKIVKLLQQKGAVLYKSKFKGHYYKIFMRSLSWTDADKKCRALGGYLASVENEEENNFLTDLAGGLFVWIGGLKDKKSNLWKWSNGSPFKYTKWQMGQPDNYGDDENYIALCPDGGWNDLPVDPRRFALQDIIIKGFICEWDRHPRKIMGK